eukprot:TRINITY_DN4208_c0_g1_i3.p2 TRINITY_DN4208_c0_g1~~TRINITY_DN4208_c0_g1_i3.p2  ORF type:complete len:106 (-),score=24.94 TRINITY_DN4208_c0_g1_i3:57-374(-)
MRWLCFVQGHPKNSWQTPLQPTTFMDATQLQALVKELDGGRHTLDPELAQVLVDIADNFVAATIKFACQLAQHRGDQTVRVHDIALAMERQWGTRVPTAAARSTN